MDLIDDVSRGVDQSPIRRLTAQASRVPAVDVPFYEPEQVPRLAAPSSAPAGGSTPALPPPEGPISRAAGMASRAGLAGGAAGLLAGGAAATEAATGTVAANPEYFKSSIGDDGLAANIMSAAQPQRIADVAQAPTTARSQNGPTNVPLIAQVGAQDLGQRFPPMPQQQPDADPAYRTGYLGELQNQAYRESDPIGQIIQQRTGPQSIAQVAQTPATGGIIGGGDTVYSPGMPAQRDPYKTADGRTINPNDPNLPAGDRDLISQYQGKNAQLLADMQAEQRANPMDGAVQIIRPGNQVTMAVQGQDRMVEMDPTAHAAYRQAFAQNPQLAQQASITANGPVINGNVVPAEVIAGGDKALQSFTQASQQDAINKADPNAAQVRAKVAETMGDTGIATGATNPEQAAANAQVTGADYLKTLPQARSQLVKMIGEGSLNVTPQLLTKNPGLLSQVGQAYPDFDQKDYNSRYNTAVAFNKGKQGDAVRAANQAIAHMGSLNEAIDKLDNFNGAMSPLNYVVNPIEKALGDTRQGLFEQKAQAVASELRKVFAGGGGGSLAELEEWRKSLPVNASQEQQKAYLKSGVELLNGAVGALQSQYDKGMGKAATPRSLLSPEAQKTLAVINGGEKKEGGTPAASTAPVRKSAGGKTYENDGHGWYEVQ